MVWRARQGKARYGKGLFHYSGGEVNRRRLLQLWRNEALTKYIVRFAAHRLRCDADRNEAVADAWADIIASTNGADPRALARRAIWRKEKRVQKITRNEISRPDEFSRKGDLEL